MEQLSELNQDYMIVYRELLDYKKENPIIDKYNGFIYLGLSSSEELLKIRRENGGIISTFEALRDEIVEIQGLIDRINKDLRIINNLIATSRTPNPAVSANIDSQNSIKANIGQIKELNTSINEKYSADPTKIREFSELMKELYIKRNEKIITCENISKWACDNNFDQEFIHLLILQSARYFANFLLGGKSNDLKKIKKILTPEENDIIKEWMNKEEFGGMDVEKEHIGVPYDFITKKIANDHFVESEYYYAELQKMESKLESKLAGKN